MLSRDYRFATIANNPLIQTCRKGSVQIHAVYCNIESHDKENRIDLLTIDTDMLYKIHGCMASI